MIFLLMFKKLWNLCKSDIYEIMDPALIKNNFDDTAESIIKRIASYNEKTRPLAQKYKAKVVNAERTADEIFADVQKVMESL